LRFTSWIADTFAVYCSVMPLTVCERSRFSALFGARPFCSVKLATHWS
jgi:hypothetical protein